MFNTCLNLIIPEAFYSTFGGILCVSVDPNMFITAALHHPASALRLGKQFLGTRFPMKRTSHSGTVCPGWSGTGTVRLRASPSRRRQASSLGWARLGGLCFFLEDARGGWSRVPVSGMVHPASHGDPACSLGSQDLGHPSSSYPRTLPLIFTFNRDG